MKANSYGIKEVADLKLYRVNPNSRILSLVKGDGWLAYPLWSIAPEGPIYEFDSLKVSNIEVSSEMVTATGGRGNAELIAWQYGKQVTLNVTDALISMKTLGLMFGAAEGEEIQDSVTIDSKSFPSVYAITGYTMMRSYVTGEDEPFFFYIPKAQIQVGGTLTMEAEGDPSTFEMTIKALAQDLGEDKDVLIQFFRVSGEAGRLEDLQLSPSQQGHEVELNGILADDRGTCIDYDTITDLNAVVEINGVQYTVPLSLVEEG